MRRTTLLPLLCAAALALVVGGCGSDDRQGASETRPPAPDRPVDTLLASTFGERGDTPVSGRLTLSLRVRGDGVATLPGPLSVRLTGPFDLAGDGGTPRFDIRTVIDPGPGGVSRSGAVSTGSSGFVRMRGRAYALPPALYRQAVAGRGARPTFHGLGIDPRRWLLDARRGAVQSLDDGPAIHLAGDLNVPRMLDDLDALLGHAGRIGVLMPGSSLGLSRRAREQIVTDVRSSSVDIWTGAHDWVLRRLAVDVDLGSRGSLELRFRLRDVDEPQVIEAPASARPLGALLTSSRIGALLRTADGDGRGSERPAQWGRSLEPPSGVSDP